MGPGGVGAGVNGTRAGAHSDSLPESESEPDLELYIQKGEREIKVIHSDSFPNGESITRFFG